MPSVLIVGANRGLGASLTRQYAARGWTVFGTMRSKDKPEGAPESVNWVGSVDLMQSDVGSTLAAHLKSPAKEGLDLVIISAGVFITEDFNNEGPKWDDEVRMYKTSSIAPVFIVHQLAKNGLLRKGSKIILISSEAGSIALRTSAEGNYGHHASKAALNMAGKLLSYDLKEEGVIVSIVHPGFMRTEMTKGVGFDKYWDQFYAVTPDEAAQSLVTWVEELDMKKSGQYWAPRGAKDIGTAEEVLGKGLPAPLELPW